MDVSSKIQKGGFTHKDLKPTRPVPTQIYCAYTYLLLPEIVNGTAGIIKILCTAPSEEECDKILQAMFESGELELEIPFVRVCPTGIYKYLRAGGDPKDDKEVYNDTLKKNVTQEREKLLQAKKKEKESIDRRFDALQKESQENIVASEDTFDNYATVKNTELSLRSFINNQERELRKLKKKLVDATKRRVTLDRKYPKFARLYKEKSKAVEEPLEQEIPELLTVEADVIATVPLAQEDNEVTVPIPEKGKEDV